MLLSLLPLGSILVDTMNSPLRSEGVIVVEVVGRTGDSLSYSPSHSRPFPAGTEVSVLDAGSSSEGAAAPENNWVRVRLLDGSESWVPEPTIERVLAHGLENPPH